VLADHFATLERVHEERLAAHYRRMSGAGKVHPKTIAAMARELCGYLWAGLHPAATLTRPKSG
jgi:hypothetical protein